MSQKGEEFETPIQKEIEILQFNTEKINIICTILSLISIILIFIVFLSNPKLKNNFAFRIIMFLLFSDFLHSIAILNTFISVQINHKGNDEMVIENNSWCKFNAFLLTLGETSALFCYLNICHFLYSSMVLDKKHNKKHMIIYHSIAYGITLLLSIIPFFTQDYGPVSYYCWVFEEKRNEDYIHYIRFLLFYVPLWVCLIIVSYFNKQVYNLHKKLNKVPNEKTGKKKKNSTFYTRLLVFSIVLFLYGAIATTHRILNWVGYEDYEIKIFVYLHNFIAQIIGMIDSIVYGMFKPVRQTIFNLITFGYYFKKKKQKNEINRNGEQDSSEDEEEMQESKDKVFEMQLQTIRQKSMIFNNESTDNISNTSSLRNKDLSFISLDFS